MALPSISGVWAFYATSWWSANVLFITSAANKQWRKSSMYAFSYAGRSVRHKLTHNLADINKRFHSETVNKKSRRTHERVDSPWASPNHKVLRRRLARHPASPSTEILIYNIIIVLFRTLPQWFLTSFSASIHVFMINVPIIINSIIFCFVR